MPRRRATQVPAGQPPESWVDGLEERARERLSEAVHRYVRQGAGRSVSAAEATPAWDAVRLLPRVLRSVTEVDVSTSLLGTPLSSPVGIAPTTLHRALDPDGEVATARAAAESGALMVVSSNAGCAFADIGATGASWWLQAYLPADRSSALGMLGRAVQAGARAVVLTADTPVVGTKLDPSEGPTVWDEVDPGWLRVNFDEGHGSAPEHEKATDLGPQDVTWLRRVTGLPVVVKGVLRPDDAVRCVEAGADAVWVSNHGGRQLDRAGATARCLPAVAAAVAGRVPVLVDGGIRDGGHVLAARALGADAVLVGRPVLWALACESQAGVSRLLDTLRTELEEALRLAGASSWGADLGDLVLGPAG